MRGIAAIVLVFLPMAAGAQTRPPAPGSVPRHAPIGIPLPRLDMPLARIGAPWAGDGRPTVPPAWRGVENGHERFDRRKSVQADRSIIYFGYFAPAYGWPLGYAAPEATSPAGDPPGAPPRREAPRGTGILRLDLDPDRDLALYVNGYYLGTSGDFDGELELEAGVHRLEIRAHGFEPLELDVRITAGRSITYRGALKPEAEALPVSTAPSPGIVPAPRTSYFIPGCYLGNVPPSEVNLPASCDLSRMTTFTP